MTEALAVSRDAEAIRHVGRVLGDQRGVYAGAAAMAESAAVRAALARVAGARGRNTLMSVRRGG